jgi:methylmalonyl-CoA epimerase
MSPVELSYIGLASRDRKRTAAFLRDDLELAHFKVEKPNGDEVDAFSVGQTALVVFEEGDGFLSSDRPGVDHIALASDTPSATREACGLPSADVPEAGLAGAVQAAIERHSACGVSTRFTQKLALPAAISDRVQRIDHIGIASADNKTAEAVFGGKLGAVYESRQTDMEISTALESFTSDKYGAVYHSRKPETVGGLRVSFLTVGDLELEFLQNFDPAQGFEIKHGSAGNTKQDQSAIGRFVETRGGGLHHIAFKVDNIDAMLKRLGQSGHQIIDQVGRPGSRRARIGFVHPSSTGGILFHFVEREELG